MRKRRNIVRDWLFYIVWYVRLKRILESHKQASIPTTLRAMLLGSKLSDGHLQQGNLPPRSPI